jgi:hypothetical protein
MALIAYHGNQLEKDTVLAQLRRHRLADEIVHGIYWESGKGCAVGCTIYSHDHEEYEPRLGIPETIAVLEEQIFEGLVNEKAKLWPERLMGAIVPGSDLSRVSMRFLHWLLTDASVNPGIEHRLVRCAVAQCAALIADGVEAGVVPESVGWNASRAVSEAKDAAWEQAKSGSAVNAACAAWGAMNFALEPNRMLRPNRFWMAWCTAGAARSAGYNATRNGVSEAWETAVSSAFAMMANKLVALIEEEGRILAVLPFVPYIESAHA